MDAKAVLKAKFGKQLRVLCAVALVALLVPTTALGTPKNETADQNETAAVSTQDVATTTDATPQAALAEAATDETDADSEVATDEAVATEATEAAADEATVEDAVVAGAAASAQSADEGLQPQAGADLSQYLSNFSFDLLQYIGSGNTPVINENDNLTRFESLGLITEFEVSGVPAGINSGDYFSFKATVPGMSGDSANYTDKPFYVGGVARGTWSTVYTPATTTDPAYITYTITLDDSWHGSSTDLIKAGIKIERFGQNSDNENLDAGGSNKEKDVTVGTETTSVKKHYKVPGYKTNVMPITNKKDAKNSAPRADNTIFWMMGYGWANMAKLCESQGKEFANNGADGVMMNPKDQDNILIDTLSYTDGTTGRTVKALSVSDIVIGSLVCAPISKSDYTGNEGAQIVADQAGDTKGISAWYTRVDGDSGTYATVQDYANALAPRQYGVYTAADGTLSVCVNYGKYGTDDTPTMEWAYGTNWAESLANSAIDKGYAQPGDKAALKSMIEEVYGSDNTLGGHIPYIQLNIVVKYPIFDEDGGITKVAVNTVTTSTEAIGTGSKEYIDVFSWGEVLPNSLKVFKYDETTNKALAGATFKLQVGKFNASSNIDWSDYEPLDGKGLLRQTGLDGIAEWHDIQVGSYRVVETAAPAGYTLGADTDAQSGGVVVGTFDNPYIGHPGYTFAVPNTPAKGELQLTKELDAALNENNTFYFKVSGPLGYYQVVPITVAQGAITETKTLTDLQPGEYTVTEVKNATGDALEGNRLTTDKHSFTVSGNNTKATVGNDVAPTPAVTITNTKAGYAEVTPAASKKLSGTLPAGFSETFTAGITAKTPGAPMPDTTAATATVNSNAETAFSGFSAISFDTPGTYEYEIAEQIGSTLGMIYDNNTYTMKVVVSDAFGVDVTYSAEAPNTTAANKAQIKNTYVTPTAKVTPQATKTLTGTLPNGFSETFTATIAAADSTLNAPLPATTTATATVNSNTETAFSGFGEITYTIPGTYEYYITETKGATNTIAYDTTVYNMKVEVHQDFTTTVTYSGNNTATDKAQIKNTLTLPNVDVTPAATKTLSGTLPNGFSGTFTATITADTVGSPMPNPATATATVTNNTETAFSGFGTITFTVPGTYKYSIKESASGVANVTDDANTYTMTVVVSADTQGKLSAVTTYTGGTTMADKAQIKNTYETTSVTGTKVWQDFSNKTNVRPADVNLTLLANGVAMPQQPTPTWNKAAGDQWTFTYNNLPKSDKDGDITYTVTEETVNHYYAPEYQDAAGNRVTAGMTNGGKIFNTLDVPTIETGDGGSINVYGNKNWDEQGDASSRPAEIKLTLTDETGAVVNATPVFQQISDTQWSYLYLELPKLDAAGNVKTYTISEEVVPGYFAPEITKVDTGNANQSYDLTNKLIPNGGKKITFTATKVWDDNNNASKIRPENIKLTLKNEQGAIYGGTPTWTKNADNTWTCTWTDLPEGKYTIEEQTVTGYDDPAYSEPTTDADGNITATVTNKKSTTPTPVTPTTSKGGSVTPASASTAKTADTLPLAPIGGVMLAAAGALLVARKLRRA